MMMMMMMLLLLLLLKQLNKHENLLRSLHLRGHTLDNNINIPLQSQTSEPLAQHVNKQYLRKYGLKLSIKWSHLTLSRMLQSPCTYSFRFNAHN